MVIPEGSNGLGALAYLVRREVPNALNATLMPHSWR